MDSAGEVIPGAGNDKVIQLLISMNLAEHESNFRSFLDTVNPNGDYALKDFTVATVALLMSVAEVPWPIVLKVLAALQTRTEVELRTDAVAVINGTHLILPHPVDGIRTYDLRNMRHVVTPPRSFVSTIYSVEDIIAQIEETLK